MRSNSVLLLLISCVVALGACGDDGMVQPGPSVCSDLIDNDDDGTVDFPDDLGCISESDDSEDSLPSAKCSDGRDNDGDGRVDYPSDPGCFASQADDETDDCPSGPMCPECSDSQDNDDNGSTDWPDDPGCEAAGDTTEFLSNPVACGVGLMVTPLPTTNTAMGALESASMSVSNLQSACGGTGAPARAYELHLATPKVVEISTEDGLTTADTIIQVRGENCADPTSEIACNDNISTTVMASRLTTSLLAGDYYIIVSGVDSVTSGNFALSVKLFNGEGTGCVGPSDCGPGLVCRVPLGGSSMVCSRPMCDDGVDDDMDGDGNDYPDDPGCASPDDNDEADTCPGAGPGCPECGDGVDNDNDLTTDHPADTTCQSKGDSSESCPSTDGVTSLTTAMTMGDTTGSNNDVTPPSSSPNFCGSSFSHTAPDKTYRIDVPAMSSLTIDAAMNGFDASVMLFGASCIGTPIACDDEPESLTVTNLAAGSYYFVMDGYGTGFGTYTINVSGKIANGGSCENVLADVGALTCNQGFTCKGPVNNQTCQPGLCGDGMDNDGDTLVDYPFDPGCDSLGDDTEANPATPPVCKNMADDDGDTLQDFPADFGCIAASSTSEVFCTGEMDPPGGLFSANPTTGTTVGLMNNFPNAMACPFSNPATTGPDVAWGLHLPVFVNSLTIDLSNSGFDTVLQFRPASCAAQIACDDDGGDPGLESKLTVSNVAPGNYAIIVDGYGTTGIAGAYTMTVKGTASIGQRCTHAHFTGGTNAILTCPTACVAGICQ